MREHGPWQTASFLGLIAVSVLVFSIPLNVAAQDTDSDSLKYWIFFRDKLSSTEKIRKTPSFEISQRAMTRRLARGSFVSNQLNLPVSLTYQAGLRELQTHIVHERRWLNAVTAVLTPEMVEEIEAQPFVRSVRPVASTKSEIINYTAPAFPVVYRPMWLDFGSSITQLDRINAVDILERRINGTGVRLGFLDSGAGPQAEQFDHPVFDRMRSESRFIESRDFTNYPDEFTGHALAVASIAAGFAEGDLIGPAHGVELLHAHTEVTTGGSETRQEEDNFVAGLEWMEAQGADVVNVSLGYYTFDGGVGDYTYDDMDGNTAITTIAADLAVKLGVVMVVSAGNQAAIGGHPCTPGQCWYYIIAPADGDSVITVGATTPSDHRAVFSSFGPTSDGRHKPDISAMGTNVVFARYDSKFSPPSPIYSSGNGTSFAAPLVSGVVAQMLQVNPNLRPMQVRDILRQTARIPDGANPLVFPNDSLGWGIVDAGAAVARAIEIALSADEPLQLPAKTIFSAPYPLPITNVVRFNIEAPSPGGIASLEVFDLLGRRIRSLHYSYDHQGANKLQFELKDVAAGVFAYRLRLGDLSKSGILTVVR